jgi:hypothetical protein
MPITVHCPGCYHEYMVREDLHGERMRCPNPVCRLVFTIEGSDDSMTGDNGNQRPKSPDSNGKDGQ